MASESLLTPRWSPMRFHVEQRRLWTSTARFKLVVAGRSSGKTELAKRYLVRMLPVPVPGCPRRLYFAAGPTYGQMERVWWQDMKDLIPAAWVKPNGISESDLSIETVFGSELHLVGLDKPSRIEGSQFCGGVIDESSDVKPESWTLSIRPTLSFYSGWCWRIGVPKRMGIGAVQYRRDWELAKAAPGESDAFWWKSADILTPEEIASAKAGLSLDDYLEQYEAAWVDTGGLLFTGFSLAETVRPCGYDPARPVYVGCDFNTDPMSWVLSHTAGTGRDVCLEVFDELYLHNVNTQKTLDVLWGRYATHRGGWRFCGDATSRAKKTSASKSDYLQIFEDARFVGAGRVVTFPAANPPRADKAANVNRMLCSAAGVRALHVDPRCVHVIDDLRLQAELTPPTDSPIGHLSDALGYLVWQVLPMNVQQAPAQVSVQVWR
jgi:hypothetical protein